MKSFNLKLLLNYFSTCKNSEQIEENLETIEILYLLDHNKQNDILKKFQLFTLLSIQLNLCSNNFDKNLVSFLGLKSGVSLSSEWLKGNIKYQNVLFLCGKYHINIIGCIRLYIDNKLNIISYSLNNFLDIWNKLTIEDKKYFLNGLIRGKKISTQFLILDNPKYHKYIEQIINKKI